MFENFLVPAYVMILTTFLVGFLHVFATLKLMKSDPRWADGVPSMPYPNAPDSLKLIKNNIQNLFEFPVIFLCAIGILLHTRHPRSVTNDPILELCSLENSA